MPFLKALVHDLARRAAQDPRVRDTAQRLYENEIKPRAKDAWERTRPEVEAAWEKAKPELQAAKEKALSTSAEIAGRVKQRIEESSANRPRRDGRE